MGGSGGGYFDGTPERVRELARRVESEVQDGAFAQASAAALSAVLNEANDRDVEVHRARLEEVKKAIESEHGTEIRILFGGSVSKRTYVEGFSDVDALVMVDGTDLEEQTPAAAKRQLAEILARFFEDEQVSVGALAVTIEFADAPLQLLPALRQGDRSWISSPDGSQWSEIDPRRFTDKLTQVNESVGGKVVPTIKLAKRLMAELPDRHRLSGYHAEALAVDIFKRYDGERSLLGMLRHYFLEGSTRVLRPIVDSTGQSIHVDDYLGEQNSLERRIVADAFGRVGRRIKLAEISGNVSAIESLFDKDRQ